MEIRFELIPLLAALTLALSIATAEPNDDARPLDDGASETVAPEAGESRTPIVWEENIPWLELAAESPAQSAAEEKTEETSSARTASSEI